MNMSGSEYAANIDIDIYLYLEAKGIKHALSGYRYLFSAIRLGVQDRAQLKSVTCLYEKVAQMYGVEPDRIERAIRYSIKKYGLTNKEFISKAVDDLVCGVEYNANTEIKI